MSEVVTQKSLIICSPYEEPDAHWVYGDETKRRQEGRRPAGYLRWDAQGDSALVPLDAVNRIRGARRGVAERGGTGRRRWPMESHRRRGGGLAAERRAYALTAAASSI